VKKLHINPTAVPLQDVDPFDVKLTDRLLEEVNFPKKHHEVGCHFEFDKLPLLKLHSTVKLGESSISPILPGTSLELIAL